MSIRVSKRSIAVITVLAGCLLAYAPSASYASVTLPEETTVDLSASPAAAGHIVGGQTIGATLSPLASTREQAAAVNPIQCMGKNDGNFYGDRVDGSLALTWYFDAFSNCYNTPLMVELDVQADLLKNGNVVDSTPTKSCSACNVVSVGPRKYECSSSCEGTWRVVSHHTFTFPAGFVITDYDTGRCTVLDPLSIRCVVRSNKLKV